VQIEVDRATCADWLATTLDPERRVVFLDTDQLGAASAERREGSTVYNPLEAQLVAVVAAALQSSGLHGAGCIGALSPYNAQVRRRSRRLTDVAAPESASLRQDGRRLDLGRCTYGRARADSCVCRGGGRA